MQAECALAMELRAEARQQALVLESGDFEVFAVEGVQRPAIEWPKEQ